MEASLLLLPVLILLVATNFWHCRAYGPRVRSGRRSAVWTYISVLVVLMLSAMILHLGSHVCPLLARDQELCARVLPLLWIVPVLLVVAVACLLMCARSLGRSLVFDNVTRDMLAPAVKRVLNDLDIPHVHRLRTFCDEFRMAGGRIVVHGGSHLSRVELIGQARQAREQLTSRLIQEVRSTLGGQIIVDRHLLGGTMQAPCLSGQANSLT